MSHALFLFCSPNKCMYKKENKKMDWLDIRDRVKNINMSDLLVL